MRISTIVVSSSVLLAGLGAAFPVEGDSIPGESNNHESHSELTRRRDPPLPPGFPYVGQPNDVGRFLDIWDTRRQYDNQGRRNSPPPRPPTPRPSTPPRSPHLTRRDPPLPPGFPYGGDYARHLNAWDTRRHYDNQGRRNSPPPRVPTPRPSTPPPSPPRDRRAFYDLD
ncbi:hypothetical protein JOM56_009508 [Amanita muscaria]